MDVNDKVDFENIPGYSIEWGTPTWAETAEEKSIRNRYENKSGGFNYAGSSELAWFDFNLMILESIKRKHFSESELEEILAAISNNS